MSLKAVPDSSLMLLNVPERLTKNKTTPPRILIVEDSEINQRLARYLFERVGCEVDVVMTGHEAVEAYRRQAYDLIVMDCRLPGLDGYAATRMIRGVEREQGDAAHVPVVALTAFELPGYEERCRRAGMDGCFVKPLRRETLKEMLHRWVPDASHRLVPQNGRASGSIPARAS